MTDSIDRLYDAVIAVRAGTAGAEGARTAKLLGEGLPKMAKKMAEEAIEVGLDAVQGNRAEIIAESADLLYNLVVLWAASGVTPDEVRAEMDRRESLYGLAEKRAKTPANDAGAPAPGFDGASEA